MKNTDWNNFSYVMFTFWSQFTFWSRFLLFKVSNAVSYPWVWNWPNLRNPYDVSPLAILFVAM